MTPVVDYHLHTHLCGHATGKPKDYIQKAIDLGLEEIGFSDHAPFVSHEDPTITMSIKQLPEYHRMIEDVQKKYTQIKVKIGIEADYMPGFEDKTKALLSDYPYDYIIGSVHFIEKWAFDSPIQRSKWDEHDVNFVYRDYHALLRRAAQTKMYDIMAHVDLVKKFGHRPTEDLTKEVEKTAEVFKDTGIIIEMNASGLRKPVNEMYPSLDNLRIYCKVGVPIIFGSDAHDPQDVGRDFDKAVALVKEAGYTEYLTLTKRKIDRKVKL